MLLEGMVEKHDQLIKKVDHLAGLLQVSPPTQQQPSATSAATSSSANSATSSSNTDGGAQQSQDADEVPGLPPQLRDIRKMVSQGGQVPGLGTFADVAAMHRFYVEGGRGWPSIMSLDDLHVPNQRARW